MRVLILIKNFPRAAAARSKKAAVERGIRTTNHVQSLDCFYVRVIRVASLNFTSLKLSELATVSGPTSASPAASTRG
jgi:hypothetical protein